MSTFVAANPYPWPYNGALRPDNTALVIMYSYNHPGLTNGSHYFSVVQAVDTSTNTSGNSNEASGTPVAQDTAPGAPTGLTATGGDTTASLSWTALAPAHAREATETVARLRESPLWLQTRRVTSGFGARRLAR